MIKKIFISTLAFNNWDLNSIFDIIKKNKIQGIDLAPLTIFKTWRHFEKNLIFFKKKFYITVLK